MGHGTIGSQGHLPAPAGGHADTSCLWHTAGSVGAGSTYACGRLVAQVGDSSHVAGGYATGPMTMLADRLAEEAGAASPVQTYLELFTRHISRSPRPKAARRMFERWYPVLASLNLGNVSDTTVTAVTEIASAVAAVDDPVLELQWLERFPSQIVAFLDDDQAFSMSDEDEAGLMSQWDGFSIGWRDLSSLAKPETPVRASAGGGWSIKQAPLKSRAA